MALLSFIAVLNGSIWTLLNYDDQILMITLRFIIPNNDINLSFRIETALLSVHSSMPVYLQDLTIYVGKAGEELRGVKMLIDHATAFFHQC